MRDRRSGPSIAWRRCRYCRALIYWGKSPSGRAEPKNPNGTTHWPDCIGIGRTTPILTNRKRWEKKLRKWLVQVCQEELAVEQLLDIGRAAGFQLKISGEPQRDALAVAVAGRIRQVLKVLSN